MTTTVLQNIQNLAAKAAEVAAVDMSQTGTGGGGERRVLDAGNYLARLVEYIEKGSQKNTFDTSKPARPLCRMAFAVFPFEDVDGVRRVADKPVFVRTSDMTISNHEKAGLKKLYNRLNYRNDATKTHVAMFLGEAFLVGVGKRQNAAKTSEYNTIDTNDIKPAIDPMSAQPYHVPAVDDDAYRVFLWDYPTQETWDALFIDGKREDGSSMNFIQEEILGATDYNGSALQQLLEGTSSIPAPVADDVPWEEPAAPAAPEPVAPAIPAENATQIPEAAPAAPEVPAVPVAPTAPAVPTAPQV